MKEIKNKIQYINVNDLKLLKNNPRKISKENLEKLKKSIKDNKDYFEARPLIISNRTGENVIIAGNQRYKASKEIGLKEVPCIILPDLTEEKEKEIIIRDNVELGEFDLNLLDDYNLDDLKDWGVDLEKDLKMLDNEIYTTKIETPIYEPIGWDVSLKDCLNTEKGDEYIKEIENSNIQDKELKDFLLASATRLYEFNFKNIAEYYSKITDTKIKNLFEKLALVIIDSNKAIENGYIEMVEQLKNLFKEENKKDLNE